MLVVGADVTDDTVEAEDRLGVPSTAPPNHPPPTAAMVSPVATFLFRRILFMLFIYLTSKGVLLFD